MRVRRLVAVLALATGCTEDVGACFEDGKSGLDTVIVGGTHVEYAGQAILNTACAVGCHNSNAKGKDRNGAPAGLDFNLNPVNADDLPTRTNAAGKDYALLMSENLAGLRERQRVVFSERNLIWQQVKDGLMPPDGPFKSLWKLGAIFDSAEASPCTRGSALPDIDGKRSQDMLRNWLACQAPIVEAYGGPAEPEGIAGRSGFQYPACEESAGGATLTELLDGVLATGVCVACHPAQARDYPLDLSSLDAAYATLVEDDSPKCNGKPYVTPNNAAQSFLIDVVTLDDPGCDIARMPKNFDPLSASQVDQLRAWIMAGAPR